MAEVKKTAIKKNARGMLMGRGALEKFKDLIQTIKSEEGIDFGDDDGFDTLLEFYMNCVEEYNAMVDGEGPQFYASTKKSKVNKSISESKLEGLRNEVDELIEYIDFNLLNSYSSSIYNNFANALFDIQDAINNAIRINNDIGGYESIFDHDKFKNPDKWASTKKSKIEKDEDSERARYILWELGVSDDTKAFLSIGNDDRMCVEVPMDAITIERNLDCYEHKIHGNLVSIYLDKSTKKSIPKSKDTKMSFTDNVNKMRVNNYAKTGNINTVMKKRD